MSINAVSFAAKPNRPYGYDPEKGEFTPEQAKKDFRPGLIPEKKESHVVRNSIFAIGTIAAIASGIYFLTKGKGIDKVTKFYNGVKGENFVETLKNIKDNAIRKIKKSFSFKAKNDELPQGYILRSANGQNIKGVGLREYALANRDIKTVPLKGYEGVNVNSSPLNIGERNKYVQDLEKAMQEYEKKAAQA